MSRVELELNGRSVSADVEDRTLLVEFLREARDLTGTHVGCDTSQCGACVVHVDGKAVINVELKYYRGKGVIEEIKRVSRPGLRNYKGKEEVKINRAGLGISILSTNQGLMTNKQALAAGIGGEVLCTVF